MHEVQRNREVALQGSPKGANRAAEISPPRHLVAMPPTWVRDREAFVVLQHVESLGRDDPAAGVECGRIMHDLGLTEAECADLVAHLWTNGYLVCPGLRVTLTEQAMRYLRVDRGRRWSVRPHRSPSAPPSASGVSRPGRAGRSSP